MIRLKTKKDPKNVIPLLILNRLQKRREYRQKPQKDWIEMVQIPNQRLHQHTEIVMIRLRRTNLGGGETLHRKLNVNKGGDSDQSLQGTGKGLQRQEEGLHHPHPLRSHQKERVDMTQTPEDKLHQNDQAKRRADHEVEMIMLKENKVIIETRKNVVTMVKYQKNPDQSQKWSLLKVDQNMMTATQGTNIKGHKDRDLKTVSLGLQKNDAGPHPMSEGQRAIKMRDHLQKCLRGIVKIHLTTSHPHNVEKGDKILPHPSQLAKIKLAVKKERRENPQAPIPTPLMKLLTQTKKQPEEPMINCAS